MSSDQQAPQPTYPPQQEYAQQPYQQQYPAQQYGQPTAQQPYGQPVYVSAAPPTNVFAIVAIISVWFLPLLGIIFGHISLGQIRRTGENGRGLALTGVIAGYIYTGLIVLFFAIYIVIMIALFGTLAAATSSVSSYSY